MGRWTFLVALMSIGLNAAGCRADPPPGPPDQVVLVVSGLRAQAGLEGAEAALYDGLGAAPAVRFANAYAQSCEPFISLGSMLTGRYPSAIPLCGVQEATDGQPWCTRIPSSTWTLPEVMTVYGYQTGAYVADAQPRGTTDWTALRQEASTWWAQHAETPRLYLVQIPDLHLLQHVPDTTLSALSPEALLERYIERAAGIGEELAGLLSASLPSSPNRDREVWLTSTSGLSLREETGGSSHLKEITNKIIVDRTVHVPLARLSPGRPGGRERDDVVELIDLLPTLVVAAGGEIPAGAQGRPLLTDLPDDVPWAYTEFGDMMALRQGQDLLTFRFFLHNASSLDPRLTEGLRQWTPSNSSFYALHDVRADPLQERDEAPADPDRAEALRAVLLQVRSGPAAPPPETMTAERLQALKDNPADSYW